MWDNLYFANDETVGDYTSQYRLTVLSFFLADHLRCRNQAALLHEMALALGDKYNFVVIDVVESPETVKRCGVTDVPAMIFVRQNTVLGGYNGVVKPKHRTELVERLALLQSTPIEDQFVDDATVRCTI